MNTPLGPRIGTALVAVAVALAITLGGARPAVAQQVPAQPNPTLVGPPPPNPPPTDPPSEPGLAVVQVVVGTFGVFLAVVPFTLATESAPAMGAVGFFMAPALGGLIVCAVGQTSSYYEGGCGGAAIGATVGALSLLPLALIGCTLERAGNDDHGCFAGAILGVLVGYFVGSAVGATIGWNLGKRPRVLPTPPPPPLPAPAMPADWFPARPRAAASSPFQLTIPVLTFSF